MALKMDWNWAGMKERTLVGMMVVTTVVTMVAQKDD